MLTFLRRASLRYVNQSSIPTLVKRLESGIADPTSNEHTAAQHAQTFLTYASKHCPSLYKAHFVALSKAVVDQEHPVLVERCLQALSAVVRWDPGLATWDKSV